jgi:hypothetical protein
MSKKFFCFAFISLLCMAAKGDGDYKQLDITKFNIIVPKHWHFQLMQGEETFAGVIRMQKSFLAFNYKEDGLANELPDPDNENSKIDTTAKYIIITIWPKTPASGVTGVSIKDRSSAAKLTLMGTNLNEKEQAEALQAFKTIQLKK